MNCNRARLLIADLRAYQYAPARAAPNHWLYTNLPINKISTLQRQIGDATLVELVVKGTDHAVR